MKLALIFPIILISLISYSQTSKTIDYGGITREYIEYVPAIYDSSTVVPVIFCLHGLGDNMSNFSNIGMHDVADTANIIVITPQALMATVYGYDVGTAWNSGASTSGIVLNDNIDDIGLFMAILDTTMSLYNVDTTRIYATGFSMGGFMCHRIASDLNSTFTAVASVSGTMGNSMVCAPTNAISVLHFHGTIDSQVAYTGNSYGNDAEDVVEYWRAFNNCDSIPVIDSIPDNAADGKSVIHYHYQNGENNTDVEFFKIIGGDHDWLWTPTNDIDYTKEIWKFLSRYPKNNSSINNPIKNQDALMIFPNPSDEYLQVKISNVSGSYKIQIYNSLGEKIDNIITETNMLRISTSHLKTGVYFIKVNCNNNIYSKNFLILH